MTLQILCAFWGWAALINIALLLIGSIGFFILHDFIYRIHSKLFNISVETFDSTIYKGLMIYKILILMFTIVPYITLFVIQ